MKKWQYISIFALIAGLILTRNQHESSNISKEIKTNKATIKVSTNSHHNQSIKKQEPATSHQLKQTHQNHNFLKTKTVKLEPEIHKVLNDPIRSFQEKREYLFSLFGKIDILDELILFYHSTSDRKIKKEILRYSIRIGGQKAEIFLRTEWYSDLNKKERIALLQALSEGSTIESYQFLLQLYKNDTIELRAVVADSILSYPDGPEFIFQNFIESEDDELIQNILESMTTKTLDQHAGFLNKIIKSDLIDDESKERIINAVDSEKSASYNFLLDIVESHQNNQLKIEALNKIHEIDDNSTLADDISEDLINQDSDDVRKAMYEALHLQDNLNTEKLIKSVIKEKNDDVFIIGMRTIIHDLKLNGRKEEVQFLDGYDRLTKIAHESNNEIALKLIQ